MPFTRSAPDCGLSTSHAPTASAATVRAAMSFPTLAQRIVPLLLRRRVVAAVMSDRTGAAAVLADGTINPGSLAVSRDGRIVV
jgi:hypothetical protein